MAERYPDDAALLALSEDPVTGVEYIPTGRSPYFLEFRKLVQRLLLSLERANDLRVYQEGDLTVGVRSGRCFVSDTAVSYGGASGVAVASDATTHFWLDGGGVLQSGTAGLPTDRTAFVPLAEVVAGTSTISSVVDLRGEAFLQIPDLASMGVAATASEINQVLSGVSETVDAGALGRLTAGPESTADNEHRHLQIIQDTDGEVAFRLINNSSGANANVVLWMSLPNKASGDLLLLPNLASGYLSQRAGGVTYNLIGTVHSQFGHEGDLLGSEVGKLMGVVPIDGVVSDVVLSLGVNIESSVSTDHVSASVKVNGVDVAATDPRVASSDGVGFRSTSQGDGVAAVVKSDGTENVQKGDVLTVDLVRSVSGVITVEASDVVVLVVIRADRPE